VTAAAAEAGQEVAGREPAMGVAVVPRAAAAGAVARVAAGEPWGAPAPAEGAECPPVDGFLLKLLAQVCMWVYLYLYSRTTP